MTTPTDRWAKKQALLAYFDGMRSWKGIGFLAERFHVKPQWVSYLLLTERKAQYRKLKHPSKGKRNDLR